MAPASPELNTAPALSTTEAAILHTLLYFDIFRHPLTTDELHHNCHWHACSLSETATALELLQEKGIIDEESGNWFLTGKNNLVALRREREERALSFVKKAKRYSAFISSFPFVRGVSISGSLSKGTMDKDGDIDYFIITEPRRLWIARTFLVLFKKIFLFNSKKYFCVNYFIDTNQLAIPDRNLFVATEIAYIRPMNNGQLYEEFMRANHWVGLFYPNRHPYSTASLPAARNGKMKRMIEAMMKGGFGEWLDEKLLRITLRRWKKKFAHLSDVRFEVDFRSRKNVSKHHPQGFQHRISGELEKRRNAVTEATGIKVPAMRWNWSSDHDAMKII